MRIEPEIEDVSINVMGSFNPAMFTPAWFGLHGLLPGGAVASAALQIAHEQITDFRADWLHVQVGKERFRAETSQAPHVRVRDLVVRLFRDHLHSVPLTAIGVNRDVHFQVADMQQRDRIGRTLAPVDPWGAWGEALGSSGEQGGMTSLTMTQIAIEGRPAQDMINVTVEPSHRIGQRGTGVYVHVHHFLTSEEVGSDTNGRLIEILEEDFENSLKKSEDLIDQVMSLAEARDI